MAQLNWGVDLSHWQGNPNFAHIAAAGIKFVILKATDYTSYSYATTWLPGRVTAARTAGLYVGAYHALLKTNGAAQADYCWSVVGPLGITLVAADFETWSYGTGTATLTDLQAFCARLHTIAPAVTVVVYTSPGFWGSKGSGVSLDARLWSANWGSPANVRPTTSSDSRFTPSYGGWTTTTILQWGSGSYPNAYVIDGVSYDSDVFAGTDAQLAALFGAVPPPPDAPPPSNAIDLNPYDPCAVEVTPG